MPINARQFVAAVGGKGLVIPKEGWNAQTFAVHGLSLLRTMIRAAQITQRKAVPVVARNALKIFRDQLERVIAHVTGKAARSKDPIDLMFPQHELLWRRAIEEVLKETRLDTVLEILPPIQSVMGQGYSKTGILLGVEADPDHPKLSREAKGIAQRIVGINDTTRKQMETVVRDSVSDGLTVSETAQRMRDVLPQSFAQRVLTIARTELNNAWTHGSVTMLQNSNTLTHVSVIGCQAREPDSPQWKGESTCNYPDLPVGELDDFMGVGFHINHTGTIVPSRFRAEDGSMDLTADRPAILDEPPKGESG